MTDLSAIPTPDLVRELCSRDEHIRSYLVDKDQSMFLKYGDDFDFMACHEGPARIIVVRGDE